MYTLTSFAEQILGNSYQLYIPMLDYFYFSVEPHCREILQFGSMLSVAVAFLLFLGFINCK